MLVPFLDGIRNLTKAPITWLFFLISVAVFAHSELTDKLSSGAMRSRMDEILQDDFFLKTNGIYFSAHILNSREKYPDDLVALAKKIRGGDRSKARDLGTLGLGDRVFIESFEDALPVGDKVAFTIWQERLRQMAVEYNLNSSYVYGLSAINLNWTNWISYQFAHGGFIHLLGNMVFLLIVGSALEPIIGGFAFMVLFLGGGMVAAAAFLLSSGLSYLPLVGASGSLSAIMTFFCVLHWKQPVRHFYFLFLLNQKKTAMDPRSLFYAGFVFLPAWVTFAFWFVTDLAGFLSSLEISGGVAYTAHLGGEFFGLIAGFSIYFYRRKFDTWNSPEIPAQLAPSKIELNKTAS